jgi:hypothetical protein
MLEINEEEDLCETWMRRKNVCERWMRRDNREE